MIESKFLEKLLDGEEVEWMPLGDVAVLRRGRVMSKGYLADNAGDYPVYSSQTANNGEIGSIQTYDFEGEYISWTTDGANAGTVFYRNGKFSITNVCGVISPKEGIPLSYKYIFYWLSIEAKRHVYSGMGNPKLMSNQVGRIQIPIPSPSNPEKSLAIQAEIVRILDTFTELTTELTTELDARKKQYNHYRDQLLTFEEGEVEWKTLDDVAYFQNAKGHEKLVSPDGDIVLLTAGYISNSGKKVRRVRGEDVLTPAFKNDVALVMSDLPNGRALAKAFFVESDDAYAANQRVCLLKTKDAEVCIPKFMHYVMNRNRQLLAYDSGVDQTHLKKDWILRVRFPLPPVAEQSRIVTILDKFDTLTHSISEGLPREIELRQKQYEYYRDLLLNFPKPEKQQSA